MGGNLENVAGYGQLSLGQAVHIAQNSDGGVDQRLAQFLERRLAEVWAKLNAQPASYVLPADEFALLNYYRPRFGENVVVKDATKRFWDNHKADCKAFDSRAIPLTTALPVFLGGELRRRCDSGPYCRVMCDSGQRRCTRFLGLRNEELAARLERRESPQRSTCDGGLRQLLFMCLMLIAVPHFTSAVLVAPPQLLFQSPASNISTNVESSPLECLQVAPPIAIPSAACQQTLMVHTFAFSYGQPFIGRYSPPNCEYNRVVFNFTVTSAGRQFDRLALMFLDDIEIFRTSTAEPTQNGILWSFAKDMSSYLAVFKQPRKIIFDLGNLVDNTYTGSWHTTLTATYFMTDSVLEPADVIVPVSARRSPVNSPSQFIVPESRAVNALTIPQNARKAVFTISACGQAEEEFWWSNVLTSDTAAFGAENQLNGHSPFRELQLLIDVGIEDDGNGHSKLASSIESNWIVTGKLFIWLDTNISVITGSRPILHSPDPSIDIFSKTTRTANDTTALLEYSVQVTRLIHITSTLHTSKGPAEATWIQHLAYSHYGTLTNKGNDQNLRQNTSGLHTSAGSAYRKDFAYPLWVASSYDVSHGKLTIDATMRRGKNVEQIGELALYNQWKAIAPDSLFCGSKTTNWQNGTAFYASIPSERRSYGSGSTEQHYSLSGIWDDDIAPVQHDQVLYQRALVAVNGSIFVDREILEGERIGIVDYNPAKESMQDNSMGDFAAQNIRALRGEGGH
ncbi:peptide N-acetyl-beta-D-glucosaminyl asparaginase amidase A-domain-containing protein [Boeremia exigua]|uniref:peptide N-acetyl-beta-D-glucosaminyl asparaginase amidase A-domain-containing protein n=1 Tax=Boeremia exigua TaxID=749465 RepID=UPI001E8E4A60|nr:peptide N-acetyl-beta-D-glucosaminyl asparaginase amidase A-domain-containing protein [Boeremia exigua]KAH6639460.1 peptide N-acetyl-beta-D-glucosaminyl asparaginase amidase A-domain-containing protein [Boeremia exigua]